MPTILQEADPSKPAHKQLQIIDTRPTLSAEADVVKKRDGEIQVVITVSGDWDETQAMEFAAGINNSNWKFEPEEAEGANFAPPSTLREEKE